MARIDPEYERRKAETMSRIMNLATVFLSMTDPVDLVNFILDTAQSVLDSEAASLALIEEDAQTLRFIAATGPAAETIRGSRLPLGRGLVGWVVRTGAYLISNDPYNDPRFERSFDEKSGFRTRSYLCMPVRTPEGEIIGALLLLNRRNGDYTEWDVQLFGAFCNLAAAALRTFPREALMQAAERGADQAARGTPLASAARTVFRPLVEESMRPVLPEHAGPFLVASFHDTAPDHPYLFRHWAKLPRGETVIYVGRFRPLDNVTPAVLARTASDIHGVIEGCVTAASHLPRLHNYLQNRFKGRLTADWAGVLIPADARPCLLSRAGTCAVFFFRGEPLSTRMNAPPLGADAFDPDTCDVDKDKIQGLTLYAVENPRFAESAGEKLREFFTQAPDSPDPYEDAFELIRTEDPGRGLILIGLERAEAGAICRNYVFTPDREESESVKQAVVDVCSALNVPPQRRLIIAGATVRLFQELAAYESVSGTNRLVLHVWGASGRLALTYRVRTPAPIEPLTPSDLLERLLSQAGISIDFLPCIDGLRARLTVRI